MAIDQPPLVQRRLAPAVSTAGPGAAPTVVLLHGRGADEDDLLGLAPLLPRRCAYVSLRAPLRFPYGGFAWFEHDSAGRPDESTFVRSLRILRGEIERLRAGSGAAHRLAVVGFSQGAAMAAALLLTGARADAFGVLSGFLPASLAAPPERTGPGAGEAADPRPTPPAAFLGYGREDRLVPPETGHGLRAILEAFGSRVTHREYDEGHAIADEEAEDLAAWLEGVLLPPAVAGQA